MKKLDLTNQTFGSLTVIKEAAPYIQPSGKKRTQWECICECGNTTIVRTEYLRNGHTTSCGCACGRVSHLNERFGRLVTIKQLPGGKYMCQCDCGNIIEVLTYNLTNGNTQSCGCLQKDRASEASFISLVGEKFGKLTVIQRVENNRYNHVCYECKCDCGGTAFVDAGNLRQGITQSCGCIKSRGESKINQWLTENNISFIPQYSHKDIFLSSGRRPFFDFAIMKNDVPVAFIEYQGKQHYEYSGYGWDNEKNYRNTIRRDQERREQCQKLGIFLYEIPYWDYDNLESSLKNIISATKMEN